MLKLPASAEYGLLAAVHLADMHASGDLAKASEIAERRDIPLPYLERLLAQMRASGLIESFRGPGGGHRLGREPGSVSVLDVLEALTGAATVPQGGKLDFLWERCASAVKSAMDIPLSDLAAEVARSDEVDTYQI